MTQGLVLNHLTRCTGHFENGGDGLIDLREDTTFFTVSNNILRNHDKAFGIGTLTLSPLL